MPHRLAADGCLGAAANHSLVCRYCLHGFDGTPPPDQTEHYLDPRRSVPLGTYYCPLSPGYIWRGRPAGEDMEIQLTEWMAPDGEIIKTDPEHIKNENEDDKVRKRANW